VAAPLDLPAAEQARGESEGASPEASAQWQAAGQARDEATAVIFGTALLPKVLDGTKVETRRRAREGAVLSPYRPGRDYAVQARRGGRAIARMLIESVHREMLSALTDEAAAREGFADVAAFEAYWRFLYREWDPDTEVWVIRFALLRPCVYCARPTARLFNVSGGEREPACEPDHIAAWLRERSAETGE
jgi:hypothetical protein